MKIINRTNTGLTCTFVYGNGSGCGFIGPGGSLEKEFSGPTKVLITTSESITYSDVVNETITISSSIS